MVFAVALSSHGVQDVISRVNIFAKEYKGTKYRRCDVTPVPPETDEYESLGATSTKEAPSLAESGSSY